MDVGFWAGLVPENAQNAGVLEAMLDAGALGLKVWVENGKSAIEFSVLVVLATQEMFYLSGIVLHI